MCSGICYIATMSCPWLTPCTVAWPGALCAAYASGLLREETIVLTTVPSDHPTSIRIPLDTKEWLRTVAKEHRQSFSQAVLYALDKGRIKIEEERRIAKMVAKAK
jgi:hypothetical protein